MFTLEYDNVSGNTIKTLSKDLFLQCNYLTQFNQTIKLSPDFCYHAGIICCKYVLNTTEYSQYMSESLREFTLVLFHHSHIKSYSRFRDFSVSNFLL